LYESVIDLIEGEVSLITLVSQKLTLNNLHNLETLIFDFKTEMMLSIISVLKSKNNVSKFQFNHGPMATSSLASAIVC
jgi:hypothetical protein